MGPPASMQFLHVIRKFIMIFFFFFFSSTSNGIQYEKPLLSGKSHLSARHNISVFALDIEVGADDWAHCVQHFHQKKGSLIK